MRVPSPDSIAGKIVAYLREHPGAGLESVAVAVYEPRPTKKAVTNAHKKTATQVSGLERAGLLRRLARGQYVVASELHVPGQIRQANALAFDATVTVLDDRVVTMNSHDDSGVVVVWPADSALPAVGVQFLVTIRRAGT